MIPTQLTPEQIKAFWPNATASVLAANGGAPVKPQQPVPQRQQGQRSATGSVGGRTAGNGSESVQGKFYGTNPNSNRGRSAAELECHSVHAALEAAQAQSGHQGKVLVRVTSIRRRLLDPDNLCEKYHVDCCRYSGLLRDDSPEHIEIQTTQRKAVKGEKEATEIEIRGLPDCRVGEGDKENGVTELKGDRNGLGGTRP